MLELGQPDEVTAFWDGESPGTASMIELVRDKKTIPVTIVGFPQNSQDSSKGVKMTMVGSSASIDPFP